MYERIFLCNKFGFKNIVLIPVESQHKYIENELTIRIVRSLLRRTNYVIRVTPSLFPVQCAMILTSDSWNTFLS